MSVIDQEFGRINQLHVVPHLKIFIAKNFADDARKTAVDDGFFIIELAEKAIENTEKMYEKNIQ